MSTPTPPRGLSSEICSPTLVGPADAMVGSGMTIASGTGADAWLNLFATSGFPRRWQGGQWSAGLGWLHSIADLAIFGAYVSITLAMFCFLARRRDFPYRRFLVIFGLFVLSCGLGHAIEAIIFWHPIDRLAGRVKAFTAFISWMTVAVMIGIMPRALRLKDLNPFNLVLQAEVQERKLVEIELRRSEAESRKLAMIASRTDNAVIITDPQGRVEWVNEGFTRITGYSADEAKGRTPGSLLRGAETDPGLIASMRERIARGEGFQEDVINYTKDGRKYWIHIEAHPIHDADGRLIHFMALESDITERKQAETALIALNDELETRVANRTLELARTNEVLLHEVAERRRTEAALIQRTLVATLNAAVGAALSDGSTLDEALHGCVEAVVAQLGMAFARIWTLESGADTLILRASAGLYTHLDGPHGQIRIGQFKIGRIAKVRQAFVCNNVREDPQIGDHEWAEREGMVAFAGFPLIVDDRLVGVMGLFARRPIDELLISQIDPIAQAIASGIVRKWTEEDLRRSEERFHLAARATNEVIWDWDIASTTVSWSAGIEALIGGLPGSIVMGRAWWEERVHPDDLDRMRDGFRAALEGDVQIWSSEYQARRLDGSYVHVLDRGFILRDEDDRPVRVIGAMIDLTERMQARLQIRDLTERMEAEREIRDLNARLEQRLHRLDALRQIDVAISASLDLGMTLGIVVDQVLAQLRVDAAAIVLGNSHDQALSYAAAKGFRTNEITAAPLGPGNGFAGLAVSEQRLISIPDLDDPDIPFVRRGMPAVEGFGAYHAIPLVARGQVQGVLEVYHRHVFTPDHDWLAFLETLANQAAIAVDSSNLLRDLQRSHSSLITAYDATIEGWARALDLRDKESEGHSRRVTEMTIRLGRVMGLGNDELIHMRRGALLHDIGKLGIPDSILLKPGKLTEEEWRVMRRHPTYAYEWLSPISFLKPAVDIPYCHHERWDGTGYPRGLKGDQIPLSARIFAAVDIWDALRSHRPYRPGWSEQQVVEYLQTLAGNHLDPDVVDHFLWTLRNPDLLPNPNISDARMEDRLKEIQRRLDAASEMIFRLELESDQLKQSNIILTDLSETDHLTCLKNRRYLLNSIQTSFSKACSADRPLSLVMLDVDHFKSYNDHHGHHAGDNVLRALASILRDHVRPQDLVVRYGGEEFMVLLPDADAQASHAVAERLRIAIADYPWPNRAVTASFGVATVQPEILDAFELIEAADAALYQSKNSGRDRVTHRQSPNNQTPLSLSEASLVRPMKSLT